MRRGEPMCSLKQYKIYVPRKGCCFPRKGCERQRKGCCGQRKGCCGQRKGCCGQRKSCCGQRKGCCGQRKGCCGQRKGCCGQRKGCCSQRKGCCNPQNLNGNVCYIGGLPYGLVFFEKNKVIFPQFGGGVVEIGAAVFAHVAGKFIQ